jgi:anionic cell wall polymer biosynthesis LytR-Cps2A-Psr (LCP) family protein
VETSTPEGPTTAAAADTVAVAPDAVDAPADPAVPGAPTGDTVVPTAEAPPVETAAGRAARRRASEEAARQQSHRAHRRLALTGVVALVLVALLGGLWSWWSSRPATEDPTAQPTATATGPTQPTLLIQITGKDGVALGSTLASVGGPLGRANLVAVPQNTVVDVATGGTLPFGQVARLPDPNGSAAALSDAIGVNVDGSLALDELAFSGLVDAVGGVKVDVDVDVVQAQADGSSIVLVPAGAGQLLQGPAAVAYATYLAEAEPEEARMARWTAVLRAVVGGLPADVAKIETILTQLGASAKATVPFAQLASFFTRLNADITADDVVYKNLPVQPIDTGGPAAYRVDQDAAAVMVAELFPEAVRTPGPNSKVRVLVQNGVGSPGLNAAARQLLVDAGFTYVNGGNAPAFGQAQTAVVVPDATAESLKWGADIAKALTVPTDAVQVASGGQTVADVIVVLGADFKPTAG